LCVLVFHKIFCGGRRKKIPFFFFSLHKNLVVILGLWVAHMPDERVRITEVVQAMRAYVLAALRYLSAES